MMRRIAKICHRIGTFTGTGRFTTFSAIMSKTAHRIYVGIFVVIILFTLFYLLVTGLTYYGTGREERFFHDNHQSLKPSGAIGHGLGIVGTLLIIIGVSSYMIRKRVKRFRQVGKLKYWLEFHIFLCVLGPVMILFHTAFKFGGIVSVSFWSMIGVVASGVIGRFIYIQIPRTINGRELSLQEVRDMQTDVTTTYREKYNLSEQGMQQILALTESASATKGQQRANWFTGMLSKSLQDRRTISQMRSVVRTEGLSRLQAKQLLGLVKEEISLDNKIARLQTMRQLFKYWHVAHLPFAIVMLVIMLVHVGVTLAFGYRWIF